MKVSHIYRSFVVYQNESDGIFKVDGYDIKFETLKEANKFIKNLKFQPILNDTVVGTLTRMGYFRTAFVIQYEGLVTKEKWSNHEVELTFYYDSKKVDIEGTADSMELLKIIKLVYNNTEAKKNEEEVLNNIIKGQFKNILPKISGGKNKISNEAINKISKSAAACVYAHILNHH